MRALLDVCCLECIHIFKTLAPDTGRNCHYEALILYNGMVLWSLPRGKLVRCTYTFILLTRWSLSSVYRLKQPPRSSRGCCWTSEKDRSWEPKVGSGECGGRHGAGCGEGGGGWVEKKSWMRSWHFCLRWGMLCWCHTWNVSEVSVINTSIRNLHIPHSSAYRTPRRLLQRHSCQGLIWDLKAMVVVRHLSPCVIFISSHKQTECRVFN